MDRPSPRLVSWGPKTTRDGAVRGPSPTGPTRSLTWRRGPGPAVNPASGCSSQLRSGRRSGRGRPGPSGPPPPCGAGTNGRATAEAWPRHRARRGRARRGRGRTRGRDRRAGGPVKNLAAMQPPRQASKWPHELQAPALCGSRSSRNRSELAPHRGEPAGVAHVAGQELVVDGERAGVDVTHRVDQADHPSGAAEVEPGQGVAVGGQVEEGVAGQHLLAPQDEPVVELPLLVGGGVEVVPDVGAPAGRAQAGQPQLRPVPVGDAP